MDHQPNQKDWAVSEQGPIYSQSVTCSHLSSDPIDPDVNFLFNGRTLDFIRLIRRINTINSVTFLSRRLKTFSLYLGHFRLTDQLFAQYFIKKKKKEKNESEISFCFLTTVWWHKEINQNTKSSLSCVFVLLWAGKLQRHTQSHDVRNLQQRIMMMVKVGKVLNRHENFGRHNDQGDKNHQRYKDS